MGSVLNDPIVQQRRVERPQTPAEKNMPPAEVILWSQLRGKNAKGYKFRRQYSVGPYVVDFYCVELKLAIEIDGESHFVEGSEGYDQKRQNFIETAGIRFLRFTNGDIYERLEGVLETILKQLPGSDLP